MERSGALMTCKQTEKMIPDFLAGNLDQYETKAFLAHVESCPDCYEELSIQTLVTQGIVQLENGSSFNLQDAVKNTVHHAKSVLRKNKLLHILLHTLEVLLVVMLGLCIYTLIKL